MPTAVKAVPGWRQRVLRTLLVAALGASLGAPPAGAAPGGRQVDEAVAQLGSADYAVRERASRLLWSAGKSAEAALRRVAGDPAALPETASRARALLRQIRLGIGPDTPADVLELVGAYTRGDLGQKLDAARQLIPRGDPAARTLVRLWARETDDLARRHVAELLAGRADLYAPLLLLEGEEPAAATLLATAAGRNPAGLRDWSAYLLLTGQLDDRLKAAAAPGRPRDATYGWLCLAAGDHESARRAAADARDDALLGAVHWAAGDWKALAEEYERRAARGGDALEPLTLAAAFHRLAGNERQLDVALQRLAAHARRRPGAAYLCAEPFLLAGRTQPGLNLLAERSPLVVFKLLCHQLRFAEAFALLDQPGPGTAGGAQAVALYAEAARWHARLGEAEQVTAALDQAARAADSAAAAAAAAAPGAPQNIPLVTGAVVEAESDTGRREAAITRALAARDAGGTPGALVGFLFPDRMEEARVGWAALRALHAGEEPRATFDRLDRLMAGRAAGEELDRWAGRAKALALGPGEPFQRASRASAVIKILLEHGREADALACAEALEEVAAGEVGRPAAARGGAENAAAAEAYLLLGDRAASAGQWDRAAGLYARARSGHDAAGGDARSAALAVYLHGRALAQSGRAGEGRKLIELARLLPLGNPGPRAALADGLRRRGLADEAAADWVIVLRTTDYGSLEVGDAAQAAALGTARRGDFARAADLLDRALVTAYRPEASFREPAAYLGLPRLADDWRAKALLKAGDADAAWKLVRPAADVLPADTDWAIDWVHAFEKAGRATEAGELFAHRFKALKAVCDRYPSAAEYHNALAWLAARCGRELDAAVEHATKAHTLKPDSSAVLDTLAEAHFRRGDKARAVERIKQAVALDPKSEYLQTQLKRFESPNPPEWKRPADERGGTD